MRKITLLVLFLSTLWGYSQVKNYKFSQTMPGTYTEITGGTLLGNTSNQDQRFVDPNALQGGVIQGGYAATGPGIPIGFNFVYNGYTYDRFAVVTDGWISLGTSTLGNKAVNSAANNISSPMESVADIGTSE